MTYALVASGDGDPPQFRARVSLIAVALGATTTQMPEPPHAECLEREFDRDIASQDLQDRCCESVVVIATVLDEVHAAVRTLHHDDASSSFASRVSYRPLNSPICLVAASSQPPPMP